MLPEKPLHLRTIQSPMSQPKAETAQQRAARITKTIQARKDAEAVIDIAGKQPSEFYERLIELCQTIIKDNLQH